MPCLVGLCYSRLWKSVSWRGRLVVGRFGSGRPSSAGRAGGAAPPAAVSGRPRGCWVEPFEREEGVGAGDQGAVVVEAGVAAALVVVEPELAFELAVVELDRPAQPREPREPLVAAVLGQVRQPVVGRGVLVLGPFDDQPLPARRPVVLGHGM